jgi:hypothetical protein
MFRNTNRCELHAFDRPIQFDHWLVRFLAAMIFVIVLALGATLFCARAAMAQPGDAIKPCPTGHIFEPGPIVNGHNRQPTQAEIDERTRELWASRASVDFCR